MAKNMTTLTITIDSEQANRVLEELKQRIDSTTQSLTVIQEKLRGERNWDVGDTADKLNKEEKSIKRILQSMHSSYDVNVAKLKGVNEQLSVLSQLNYNELTKLRSTLTNSLKNRTKYTEDELAEYEEAAKRLQKVRDEIAKRDLDVRGNTNTQKAGEVLSKPQDYSTQEINQAIEATKKLRDMQQSGGAEWNKYNTQIENGKKFLDDFNVSVKQSSMNKQFGNLPTISEQALSEQKKYWQEMVNGAQQGSRELDEYRQKLSAINKEEENRLSRKAGSVMGNFSGFSVSEIQEAIKQTEKLRDAQKAGSAEYDIYSEEIRKATEYLQSYVNLNKQIDMESKWQNLSTLSSDALSEQKKYWQEMVNGAQQGSRELSEYEAKLNRVTQEEQARLKSQYAATMQNPINHSTKEVQDAIKAYEQLRDAQKTGSVEWLRYNRSIEDARSFLQRFNDEIKRNNMSDRLSSLSTASTASLAEQKKYWQEMINGAGKGSAALADYERKLKQVTDEERSRILLQGEQTVTEVNIGSWDKTIGETKEAIKQLQAYRNLLSGTNDADALNELDKALSSLAEKEKETAQGFISMQDALEQSRKVSDDTFDGTIADLEKLKKSFQEARETEVKIGDPQKLQEIDQALAAIDKKLGEVSDDSLSLNDTLENLDKASINDLEKAAEALKKQIKAAGVDTQEYIERSAKLREVNKRLEESKEAWKAKENIITKTAKRLASYVLVYAGFNEITGKLKEVVRANIELSDSLADIQKTTGLSTESVAHLSDQINDIDTRSAQKELHDLAYEAGKLGISAEEDVLAFVRAGNQLLVALGEDLGGAEAVRQLMKVNAVLGETQKLGVEQALLATGSAINEISQTSRASAGPIVDMVKRIGAIGAASKLSMADLVALAGTADAMGQSAEIAGTVFNKFLGTLQTNTADVAYALGLDPERLKTLLGNEETAIYGIIEIFEKMNLKGDMAELSPIMGELGSDGARMTQVLTTMAGGVEELKAQVFTSKQAFAEATSVTNEYNIKNESAAAILQRMTNNIHELVTRSSVVQFLQKVLQTLYYLPNVLERNRVALLAVRAIMWEIATVTAVKMAAMIGGGLVEAWGSLTKALTLYNAVAARSVLGAQYATAMRAASGVQKLTIAWRTLLMAMRANPILIAGTTIATIATAVHHFTEETNKAVKAQAEFNMTVQKEQFELQNLLIRIENANSANGERASLIQQLNNKYGQYLGFLVTEENYIRNQEYIYQLLNKQIERSIALKMQDKLAFDIASKYADLQREAFESMNSALNKISGIGEGGAREAASKLMSAIKEQARSGVKDVNAILGTIGVESYQSITNRYKKSFEQHLISREQLSYYTASAKSTLSLQAAVSDMLDIETKIAKEAADAAKLSQSNLDALNQQTLAIKRDEAEKVLANIDKVSDVKDLQEAQSKLNDYLRQRGQEVSGLIAKQQELNSLSYNEASELDALIKKRESNVKLTQEEIERYDLLQRKKAGTVELTGEDGKKLKEVNAELEKYKGALDTIKGKLASAGDFNLWGEGKSMQDADVNQLVAMYKKLESDGAKIREGATQSIQTSFWKGFKDQQSAVNAYYKEAEKIKQELESRGYNTSGKFRWGGGDKSTKEEKKKTQEEYRAAISALEAYFNERETLIQQQGLKEGKTQVQIDQQLRALQTEKLKDEIELRKLLLDEYYRESAFDPSKYKGVISGTDYFKGKNTEYLNELRLQLEKWGVAMEDGMKKQLTDRMVKIEEQALKLREKVNNLLLQDNFTEQVAKQYLDSLQELGLLFGLSEREIAKTNEEGGRLRLAYMKEWSDEAYTLNAEGLRRLVEQNTLFSDWRIGRSGEDYEALLIQLRKFHDDQEEADRKSAERRKKIFENSEEGLRWKESSESDIKQEEQDAEMWNRFRELNLVSEDVTDKSVIDTYQAKISASQAYIEQIKLEMNAEIERAKAHVEAQQAMLDTLAMSDVNTDAQKARLTEAQQQLQSLLHQQSIIVNGENEKITEYNSKMADKYTAIEQRKVQEVKKYTDAIVEFSGSMGEAAFGEVEDRQEAGKQLIKSLLTTLKDWVQIKTTEMVMEKMFATQSVATTGAQVGQELSMTGAKTSADIAAGTASATAKEAGSKGLLGLAVGAAIGAALSALLGVAMGAINKSKSEVQAISGTGSGKLVTGMLTYAEGNYPVLGNNGQVYNAKYEGSNIKTGIYGGGAHFGIFSEKKPEAIIDGDTTRRLILNHPDLWQSIVTLSKHGRLNAGVRTFETGNISELSRSIENAGVSAPSDNSDQMLQMQATMDATRKAMDKLVQVLSGGIKASINMYGDDGLYKQSKKAEKFATRRGYK